MPVVDDLVEAVGEIADGLLYDLIRYLAEALWFLIKSGLILSYQIVSIERWLSQSAFPPLIQGTNGGIRLAASMTFVIALFILGLTYLMAVWIRLDMVRPQKAFLWFFAGTIFFQIGPTFYQGFHDMRTRLSSAFYAAGLAGITGTDNPFAAYAAMETDNGDPLPMNDLCDNLGPYIESNPPNGLHQTVRGSDVALVFLRATGYDLLGFPPPYAGGYCGPTSYETTSLPYWWVDNPQLLGGYFYREVDSSHFEEMSPEARRDSIRYATLGLRRLAAAMPLVLLAIAEALIGLLLALAEGLTFLSFGLAIVFSYFNKTEGIALSIIDLMIELLIQTIVIALIQAVIVGCTFAAAATGNPFLLLGMGILSAVLMCILLWSGVKAVFNSFNRVFQAISRTTGGAFMTPTKAAFGATGLAVGTGLAAAGMGFAGLGVGASLMGSDEDDPDSMRARAMRGSGDMLRAATYTVAAVTHNPAVSLAAHTAGMVSSAMSEFIHPPRRNLIHTPENTESSEAKPAPSGLLTSINPQDNSETLAAGSKGDPHPDRKITSLENTGEEIEDAILQTGGRGATPNTQLDSAAEKFSEAVGRIRINGPDQVSSVIGNAMNMMYAQRILNNQPVTGPVSYHDTQQTLAKAMGAAPGQSPLVNDTISANLFMNRAMTLGLGGEQAASLISLVKRSEGQASPELSKALASHLTHSTGLAPHEARQHADGLLHTARIMPNSLVAYGQTPFNPPPVVVMPKASTQQPISQPNTNSQG